jgi:hypothetical protein
MDADLIAGHSCLHFGGSFGPTWRRMMLRRRLTIIALTAAAVVATTLTTAQPAQAERTQACSDAIYMARVSHHLYTWHHTFYGPNHMETQEWAFNMDHYSQEMLDSCG